MRHITGASCTVSAHTEMLQKPPHILIVTSESAAFLSFPQVWQNSGNQGDEWLRVQSHVTSQNVHQVILEATVGGEAGDIAIDDISLVGGPCPASGNKK